MDTLKAGRFIAQLRKERGLTQQELGELVGVTNKTVSRWETGTYMPPIEVMELLSKEFGVTINEIVSGERLTAENFREKAEENLVSAWRDSAFTLDERRQFFAEKWEKEHIPHKIIVTVVCVFLLIAGEIWFRPLVTVSVLAAIAFSIVNNNRKAVYVEHRAFESHENDSK